MYQLIKKDILMQKRMLKLSIFYILFFTITLSNIGTFGLTFGILTISYQFLFGASALEDKNNSDRMLISLPIKKSIIVLSKYFSIYVYTAYAILGFYLLDLIINWFNPPMMNVHFTFTGLIGGIIAVTLLFSIALPLIFKYGYLKSKTLNLIIFFVMGFGGALLIEKISKNKYLSQKIIEVLNKGSEIELFLLAMIPLTILLIFSYFLSLSFYNKREFQ